MPQEAIDELLRAFDKASAAGRSQSLEFEAANQSFYEATITPNSRGGWVVVVQDVTAKRNADRAIDRMAHFDSVTNLRNRRSFELALAEALSSTQSSGPGLDVMFLDLDDFKQVNDSLGHRTGDKLLVEIASRLARHHRSARPGRALGRRRICHPSPPRTAANWRRTISPSASSTKSTAPWSSTGAR